MLAQELGAEPSQETVSLQAQIKANTLRSKSSVSNLPIPTTRLIGRERELQQIAAHLENPNCRLLTLTGPGGIGKTRLALQAAADQRWAFANGVRLVELAALHNPALVPQTVAAALDVPEQLTQPLLQTLIDFLESRELLLVLDNCEHLVEACARFAAAVLQACPRLCILATSSEMLDIDGEQVLLVPPLTAPDPYHLPPLPVLSQYPAIRLFVDRAAGIRSHFTITGDNAFAVAQICWRLDGIPLAIELGARVKDMTAEQIAEHLDQRFQLLTGGSRTAWPQHKTLRAMMDWSYGLLSDQERTLFHRLAVFAGGWSIEAAEAICAGDSIAAAQVRNLLTQLVNKSLVAVDESGRYRLLETIREYAREKLSDRGDVALTRSQHASFFLEMAQTGRSRLRGPDQLVWSKQIVTELDNLRTAFHWARDREDAETCASFAVSLTWFWEWCGYLREGRQWLEIALEATAGRPVSSQLQARALYGLGVLALRQADFVLAAQSLEQSLALWRAIGDRSGIAEAIVYLGNIALTTGDFGQAFACYKESVALFRELGDPWGEALSLGNLGLVALFQRDLVQAAVLFDEALALLQAIGDRFFSGSVLLGKGYMHLLQGEHERAEVIAHEGLQMASKAGDKLFLNYGVVLMASVAVARQHLNRAARLLGVSEMLSDVFGVPLPPVVQIMAEQVVAAARLQLEVAFFESAWAEGRAMTLEQAVEYALTNIA